MFKGMSDLNSRAAKFSRQQAISAGCLATFRRGFSQLRVFFGFLASESCQNIGTKPQYQSPQVIASDRL